MKNIIMDDDSGAKILEGRDERVNNCSSEHKLTALIDLPDR